MPPAAMQQAAGKRSTPRRDPATRRADRSPTAAAQRERLMAATVELIGTRGYAATTISDLLAAAGVSRKAFYRHFEDKRECFLAAYDSIVAGAIERVTDAAGERSMREEPGAGLEALFDHVIENPRFPRLVFVEIRATGPAGIARREQLVGAYERLLRGGLELTPGRGTIANPLARAYVGGVMNLLATRARNSARGLRPLLPELRRWSGSYFPAPAPVKAALLHDPRPAPRTDLAGGRAPGTLHPPWRNGGVRDPARPERSVTRSFLVHCQRELVLDAVANLSAERGYAGLSLEDIIVEAGVSLSVFYDHFAGKEDAFLVAHEVGHNKARAIAERASASASDWPTGVRAGIAALLEFLSSEPAFARLALVEALIATARSAQRANLAVNAFAQLLAVALEDRRGGQVGGRAGWRAGGRVPSFTNVTLEAIAGGIFELCLTYAVRERIGRLTELTPIATYFTLAPFIGREQAGRIAAGPPAR
jgi:AcrR family transcriptional regulator